MEKYKFQAKSEEGLLEKALSELKLEEGEVLTKYYEEKGGLFSGKKYTIEVVKLSDIADLGKDLLKELLNSLNIIANIETKIRDGQIKYEIFSKNNSVLIGKKGHILDSIQVYVRQAIYNAVDLYDGASFNGYTADIAASEAVAVSTEEGNAGKYLYAYPYFTDTMKLKTGTDRPAFITLAPNSITKVRVYIYIEGQDIDNYDFASIGKQISVNFGFTKERFTEDDINYQGPNLNKGQGPLDDIPELTEGEPEAIAARHAERVARDKTAPVIVLSGSQAITIAKDAEFTRPTVTEVRDNVSTIATNAVDITGTVNTAVPGTYRVLYEVADEAGNVATEVVTVTVTE